MKLYITKITLDNLGSVTGHKLTDDDLKKFEHDIRSRVYSELTDAVNELDCASDYIEDVYLYGYRTINSKMIGPRLFRDLKPGDYYEFEYVHEDYEDSSCKLASYDIAIKFEIIEKEIDITLE